MAWSGSVGSGNLLAASGDATAWGTGSFTHVSVNSLVVRSGTITISATTGSANTLPSRPEGYLTITVSGQAVKFPFFKP